jgi:hypothetical protein
MMEKAKKPKAVSEEAAVLSPCPPEVAKGTSATNVAEEERKMPLLPKYAAVPREVFRAGPVAVEAGEVAPSSVAVEAPNDVEEGYKGGDAEKTEEVEDKDKDDKDDEDDYASGDDEKEEEGNDASD